MIITIIVFIIILSALVLVHEIGHFVVARNRGVKVEEFGFGFPPKLFSIKRGETEYSMNAIPIGGFVKMYGEDVIEKRDFSKEVDRAFFSKKVWERAAILVAGVTMNVLLAVVLLGVGHWIGLPTVITDENRNIASDMTVQVVQVVSNTPAEKAGLKLGDKIIGLQPAGEKIDVTNTKQIQDFISARKGEEIIINVSRANEIIGIKVVPRIEYPEEDGAVGFAMSEVGFVKYPWYKAIWKGAESVYFIFAMIFEIVRSLILGIQLPAGVEADVGGPVRIVEMTHQAVALGLTNVLLFASLLSISLAIINIFPFPALDGGRLLFLIIEKIKGSPVNRKIEGMIHQVGFFILIGFMIFITFRDVAKLF